MRRPETKKKKEGSIDVLWKRCKPRHQSMPLWMATKDFSDNYTHSKSLSNSDQIYICPPVMNLMCCNGPPSDLLGRMQVQVILSHNYL